MDCTPHFFRSFQITRSLDLKARTINGVDPLGQITLPLCLYASNPAIYSSSWISMAKLSPLRIGWGSWEVGTSQILDTACANVLAYIKGCWVGFFAWSEFLESLWGQFDGPVVGFLGLTMFLEMGSKLGFEVFGAVSVWLFGDFFGME